MVRGEDCPLSAELASKEAINEYDYTVADLTRSRLRLAANQWVPDYRILISSVHVSEPNELEEPDRVAYFDDLMLVGQALCRISAPISPRATTGTLPRTGRSILTSVSVTCRQRKSPSA